MKTTLATAILTAGCLVQAASGGTSIYFGAHSRSGGRSTVAVDIRYASNTAEFRAALGPHGTWLYLHPYGWVWQPNVAVHTRSWHPYCHGGSWVWTAYGWYWESDYSWGWAPFHYGRWFRCPRRGWLWVPDTVWGPAWVHWRYSERYYGWAPLPPGTHYEPGFGIYYGGSPAGPECTFGLSHKDYVFVKGNDLMSTRLSCSIISSRYYPTLYSGTSVSFGFEYYGESVVHCGPPPCAPQPPTIVYQTVYPPTVYYGYHSYEHKGHDGGSHHDGHHGSHKQGHHDSGHHSGPPPDDHHGQSHSSSGSSHHPQSSHNASSGEGNNGGTQHSAPPPDNVSQPSQKSYKPPSGKVSRSVGRRSQRMRQIVKRRR